MLDDDDPLVDAEFVAETNLPTELGHFRLRAYRQLTPNMHGEIYEPCIIYCTDKPPFGRSADSKAYKVPFRIHDQCLTSEVFGSQRCDCKEQLKMTMEYVQQNGGAVLYLQQEGRGIGLANKIAAYALQDAGMDTVDANLHLGFPEDCRQYGVVPSILKEMNVGSIQLITNNPRKVDKCQELGITVENTVPMVVPKSNPFNRKYLETKHTRMMHENFGNLLSKKVTTPTLNKDLFPNVINSNSINDDNNDDDDDDEEEEDEDMIQPMRMPKKNGFTPPQYVVDGPVRVPIMGASLKSTKNMAAAVTAVSPETTTPPEPGTMSGVHAKEDGYCFGRQSVLDAIDAVKRGEIVVVVDDEDRENEGDFIMAADKATPEAMATIIRYSSGVICVAMEDERMKELNIPPMVTKNEDPKGTAFGITVDATKEHGISTGISASDRATTAKLLALGSTTSMDFVRPGHIFPLRSRPGGTLTRDGHTEATVDLARLAGLAPCGILCEIVSEEHPTEMARLPELERFCERHGYVMTSIVDIAQYRRDTGQ